MDEKNHLKVIPASGVQFVGFFEFLVWKPDNLQTQDHKPHDSVLLKNPGVLLKDPGVLLKDPGVQPASNLLTASRDPRS